MKYIILLEKFSQLENATKSGNKIIFFANLSLSSNDNKFTKKYLYFIFGLLTGITIYTKFYSNTSIIIYLKSSMLEWIFGKK